MTYNSTSGYWEYTITTGPPTHVILNNNSSQTADLTFVNNGIYNASGYVSTYGSSDTSSSSSSSSTTTYTYTVTNNVNTSYGYVYIWDGSTKYAGEWPGTVMTNNTYTLSTTALLSYDGGIIFNHGSGGDGNQTGNLTFSDYATYTTNAATTAIAAEKAAEKAVVAIYNITGARQSQLQKGVNIVKYSDGTTSKVLVK